MKKLSIIFVLLFLGCYQATMQKAPEKQVAIFYESKPDTTFTEIKKIVVTFREYGLWTGKGSAELMTDKLKFEAARIDADAIIGVQITTTPIAGQMNNLWVATGTAIKFE